MRPGRKPKLVYTDDSKEFKKAFDTLHYIANTSTPHKPQSNAVAERCQRRIKEGVRCLLLQAGLDMVYWADAMRCYAFTRNIHDQVRDGLAPYELRFSVPFRGRKIPFGAYVEYIPSDPTVN